MYPSAVLLEIEPGSWLSTERYWKQFFNQMGITVIPLRPAGSKFNRARPLIREIGQGFVLFNELLTKRFILNQVINNLILIY